MKNKKEKIIAILLVVGLIVVTGSISYAAFRFSGLGSKVNTITTGSVTMSYTESSNVLSMSGALPTTDATGKVRLNPGEYFDFTVSSSMSTSTNINYEIAVEELDGSTMSGDFIKFYLTKVTTDGSEEEVMAPSTYSADLNANTYTGRPANMMSLYTNSMDASEVTTYRLRMYVSEEYNPQGDGGNLTYKARVNVYGLAGEKIDGGSGEEELDLSTVNTDLATNTWEDVQKVVKAGKVAEAGWKVGDTKTVIIDTDTDRDGTWESNTMTATLIGINHDGENTATFIIMDGNYGIGLREMNSTNTNLGGWKDSEMRAWLNNDIYNSMTDTKDYIKEVNKLTDNVGYSSTSEPREATITSDKIFLLSPVEAGLGSQIYEDYLYFEGSYPYLDTLSSEGTVYNWFLTNPLYCIIWLRSPISDWYASFFTCEDTSLTTGEAGMDFGVYPAFAIG